MVLAGKGCFAPTRREQVIQRKTDERYKARAQCQYIGLPFEPAPVNRLGAVRYAVAGVKYLADGTPIEAEHFVLCAASGSFIGQISRTPAH